MTEIANEKKLSNFFIIFIFVSFPFRRDIASQPRVSGLGSAAATAEVDGAGMVCAVRAYESGRDTAR